jgi:4'-phosphopantetheinyl transferase EntD
VESRRRAFAAGRRCARRLLAELGAPPGPLLVEPSRAPRWPEGFVGSISHGAGLCLVAVARRGTLLGLGVDVESDAPLDERLARRVCTEPELRAFARSGDALEAGRLAKLAFSAKEALYKCVHPLFGQPLGFADAAIEPDPATGRFAARPLAPRLSSLARDKVVEGSFAWREGRVLTVATLRADRT